MERSTSPKASSDYESIGPLRPDLAHAPVPSPRTNVERVAKDPEDSGVVDYETLGQLRPDLAQASAPSPRMNVEAVAGDAVPSGVVDYETIGPLRAHLAPVPVPVPRKNVGTVAPGPEHSGAANYDTPPPARRAPPPPPQARVKRSNYMDMQLPVDLGRPQSLSDTPRHPARLSPSGDGDFADGASKTQSSPLQDRRGVQSVVEGRAIQKAEDEDEDGYTLPKSLIPDRHSAPGHFLSNHSTAIGGEDRSVIVTGIKNLQPPIVYQYYFANPDNGGGPVDEIVVDDVQCRILVVFKRASTVRTVCGRHHVVAEEEVQVTPLTEDRSHPVYHDRLLLRGVPEIRKAELTSFLKLVTGCDVKEILYSDEVGVVLAILGNEPDFCHVMDQCQRRKVRNSLVSVTHVPLTTSVLVENLSPSTTQESVVLYFENTKRSGGGVVQSAECMPGQNTWLVRFEESESAAAVHARAGHRLEERDLIVRPYYSCLGPDGGTSEPKAFERPENITVETPYMASFLNLHPGRMRQLEGTVEDMFAVPVLVDKGVVVECTLTAATPGARSLAKQWSDKVNAALTAFFSSFAVEEIDVAQDICQRVEEAIKNTLTVRNSSSVAWMPAISPRTGIAVVGIPAEVRLLVSRIWEIVSAVEKEGRSTKIEEFELPGNILKLFSAQQLPNQVRKIYPNMRLDMQETKIVLRGRASEVNKVKEMLSQCLPDLKHLKEKCSPAVGKMLRNKQTEEYLYRKMTTKGILATWEMDSEDAICFVAQTEEALRQALTVVETSVERIELTLTEESATLLSGKDFLALEESLKQRYSVVLNLTASQQERRLVITATDDVFDKVKTEVKGFIENNTIYIHDIRVSPIRQKFLGEMWQGKLQQMVMGLQNEKVVLEALEPIIIARGTRKGLMDLVYGVSRLALDIVVQEEVITNEDWLSFLRADTQGKDVATLARSHGCLVAHNYEPAAVKMTIHGKDEPVTSEKRERYLGLRDSVEVTPQQSATVPAIVIVSGEIAAQQADVIVNSAATNLDLKVGAISASILDVAGEGLQAECLRSYPQGIRPGQIATTKGHGLKCKEVYHVTLQTWDGTGSQEKLHQTTYDCLVLCNSRGYSTIAIPALGTGVLAYPRNIVAQNMIAAVRQFGANNPSATLREVRLVVYHTDAATLEAFQQAFDQIQSQNVSNNESNLSGGSSIPSLSALPAMVAAGSQDGDLNISQSTSLTEVIQIIAGEIAKQQVDVIVNSTGDDLDLNSGAISASILKAAGHGLQDEIRSLYPAGIAGGKIAISSGHGLPCKKVLHVSLRPYQAGSRAAQFSRLHEIVVSCLDLCNAEGLSTVAFPALGTGNLSYPKDEVAKTMIGAVRFFQQKNPSSCIREVRMVVYHKDNATVQAFRQAYQQQSSDSATLTVAASPVSVQTSPTSPSRGRTTTAYTRSKSVAESPPGGLPPAASITRSQSTKQSPTYGQSTSKSQADELLVTSSRMSFDVFYGVLAEEKADAIVCPVCNDLRLLQGAVSSSVLSVAGPGVLSDLQKKYPQGIQPGEIATVAGQNANCQELFFVCLPDWAGTSSRELLHTTTVAVLSECQARGYQTVALPPLGWDALGYPCDQVAEVMLTATQQFAHANPTSSLREVKFVVYWEDEEVYAEFELVRCKLLSSVTGELRQSGTRINRTFSNAYDVQPRPKAAGGKRLPGTEWECDVKGVRLLVRQGDVTEADTEALINAVNTNLDLAGDIPPSLKRKCGTGLENELLKKKDDMKHYGVVTTKGYNCSCSVIVHVNVGSKKVRKALQVALEEADRQKAQSVALAPMGDKADTKKGIETFSEELLMAMLKFGATDIGRHVREVHVFVQDALLIPPFIDELQNRVQKTKDGTLNRIVNAFRKSGKSEGAPRRRMSQSAVEQETNGDQCHTEDATDRSKLFIYGQSMDGIEHFLRALEKLVQEKFITQQYTDPTLHQLTLAQMQQINVIGETQGVKVELNAALGRYTLHGLAPAVAHAHKDILDVVREAEKQLQEREKEIMMANLVQWAFLERTATGTKLIEYDKSSNMKIEKAFQDKKKTKKLIDDQGQVYIVDFDTMEEYPKGNHSFDETVQVVRKNKCLDDSSSINLPLTWCKHPKDEAMILVPLKATDPEYITVEKNVRSTLGPVTITILSIDRIQNRPLYQQYAVQKAHMDKQNGSGFVNEKILWHGTASEAIQNINNHGFNRSYCGKNATHFGEGVYFAVECRYSTDKKYSPLDPSGHRYLYQCRVLTGHPTNGKPDMRFLPSRSGNEMYDSATDDVRKPAIYVIFNDTKAYPEYLIKFK